MEKITVQKGSSPCCNAPVLKVSSSFMLLSGKKASSYFYKCEKCGNILRKGR